MFLSQSQKFCIGSRVMKDDFQERLCDSLRRRLSPNTGLHIGQVAYAIGCSDETLKNTLRKQHALSSHYVAGLIDFFTRAGDYGFICDLYPNAVTPLVQRNREADQALELVKGLKTLIGAAA